MAAVTKRPGWWTEHQLASGLKEQWARTIPGGGHVIIELEREPADVAGPTYLVTLKRSGEQPQVKRYLQIKSARDAFAALVNTHTEES